MGVGRSRVPWISLVCGLLGGTIPAFALQVWVARALSLSRLLSFSLSLSRMQLRAQVATPALQRHADQLLAYEQATTHWRTLREKRRADQRGSRVYDEVQLRLRAELRAEARARAQKRPRARALGRG